MLKSVMEHFRITLKPAESFGISTIQSMANYFPLPQAGAASKGFYLKKKHHLAYTDFGASLLYCFILSLAATGLIGIVGLTASGTPVPALLWLILLLMPASLLGLLPIVWKLPLLRSMVRLSEGLKLLSNRNLNIVVFLQNIGITLLVALGLYFSFLSFGHPVSWSAALILAVGPVLAGIIKLTPGNMGLVESIAWTTAVAIGVHADQTVACLAIFRVTSVMFFFTLGPFFAKRLWTIHASPKVALAEAEYKIAA